MSGKRYRTPKGKDERELPYPSTYTEAEVNELKRRGIKFINWHGFAIAEGPGFDAGFFDTIMQLRREIRSIIILITGKAGEGKTWAGMRLCEMFDPEFDVDKQICYTIPHILKLISTDKNKEKKFKIKKGQCILIDEAQFVAGVRNWYDELQKELMSNMVAIRKYGYIIIIVALHRGLLDKVIRKHLLTYQLHTEDRGQLVEYSIFLPRFEEHERQSREGQIILPVPGHKQCSCPDCLECDDRDWCMNMRAIYERNKDVFLESTSARSIQKAEDREKREEVLTIDDYIKIVLEEIENGEKIEWTNQGAIDKYWILDILERRDHKISEKKAIRVTKTMSRDHPDIKKEETEGV